MYKSIKVPVALWRKLKQLALDKDTTIAKVIEESIR
jgi:predicted DNA-binding ribbon-helix-helix protein